MITIAYFTSRTDPKIEWFFRSLKRELKGDFQNIEVIVVDYYMNVDPNGTRKSWMEKLLEAEGVTGLSVRHVPPKPSAWQGPHRFAKGEHFAASNARNTAFALCRGDYIACVDDLSVLMAGWFTQLRHSIEHKYLVLGAYKKVNNLSVDADGNPNYDPHPPGVDSRWNSGSDSGIVRAGGSWMFGCSFGLPLEYALKVNGFDELCDGTGMEDCEFGMRIERTGCKLFYNRNMLTLESDELHHIAGNQKFIREAIMTKQGVMSDWAILYGVRDTSKTWTLGNDFNLRDVREKVLRGEPFPKPTKDFDWRTGKPLSET